MREMDERDGCHQRGGGTPDLDEPANDHRPLSAKSYDKITRLVIIIYPGTTCNYLRITNTVQI